MILNSKLCQGSLYYFFEKVDIKHIYSTNVACFHNYSYMVQPYGDDGEIFDPNIKFDYNLFFFLPSIDI